MEKIRTYYYLAKPGIIYGNLTTAAAGFLFASGGGFDIVRFVTTLLGIGFVIGSACVVNNYFDRDIDQRMERTKKRAIPAGVISGKSATWYAFFLAAVGFALLLVFTNSVTVLLGVVAYLSYTIFYTRSKRTTVHSTLIGTLPGALPLVAGYTAVMGVLDMATLVLFSIMVCWQMAHFYAIGLYRKQDYRAAKLPIFSVVYDESIVRRAIVIYVALFFTAALSLFVFGYAGIVYGAGMAITAGWWLTQALGKKQQTVLWAKSMFGTSLWVLLIFSALLALNPLLP